MNKLELYQSASAAALASLDETNAATVDQTAAAAFNEQKLNPLDYQEWKGMFANCRRQFLQLKAQPTLSAQAAARKAPAADPAPKV